MMRGMVLLAVSLLVGIGGCGPGVSDESSAPASVARQSAGREASGTGQAEHDPSSLPPSLRVPDWMQAALKHPDTQVRLQALERWVQQGRTGGVEPLMLALTDADERVRTKALQLIEQDWVAEQAAKP